mmetsp:Transcript_25246/g.58118  ORF Transcript_25246/g.58118 Transcript_25246/m.58118 type:complete len:264 (-) Transcript_25246:45-836(-)
MVFFVYINGGAGGSSSTAIAASAGCFFLSILLSQDWQVVKRTAWGPMAGPLDLRSRYSHTGGGRNSGVDDDVHEDNSALQRWVNYVFFLMVGIVLCMIALGLGLWLGGPRTQRWVSRLLGQAAAAAGPARRAREVARSAEVEKLPVELYVSEEELRGWTAAQLKEELRRLQRQADMRMKFSGGSAARDANRLLCSGGVMEKKELVAAVIAAHGGNSMCSVCLGSYDSGDRLRVLPCGHRYHVECVDKWLIEQSRTCPLCSKRL